MDRPLNVIVATDCGSTTTKAILIEKVGENLYRSYVRPFRQKPYRLGYAAQGTDYQFSSAVSRLRERV